MSETRIEYFASRYVSKRAHEEDSCKSDFYLNVSKVFGAGSIQSEVFLANSDYGRGDNKDYSLKYRTPCTQVDSYRLL
jgi:hypothetical protein